MDIHNHDKYLDPPDEPAKGECVKCGDMFEWQELNDDCICEECQKYQDALDQERE